MKILCIWRCWLPHEREVSLSQHAHPPPPPPPLSASALFSVRTHLFTLAAERSYVSVKTQIYCFSNFTCKYSRNHSTAIVFILCVAYLILSDDGTSINQDFCADEHLEREIWLCSLVLIGRVSVIISYSSRSLTTDIIKYINENSFIENLVASK